MLAKSSSTTLFNSNLSSALFYRGAITGDLNRGKESGIPAGYYTIDSGNAVTNLPSGTDVAWCTFIQFKSYDTQMIIATPYIYIRKYTGNPASWSNWTKIS